MAGLAELLAQLEQEARAGARQLENDGRLSRGFTDAYYPPRVRGDGDVTRCGVPFDPWAPIPAEAWQLLRKCWPDAQRLTRAHNLAGDVDTCAALLRGEAVPGDRLDPEWLVRYGTKDSA